jgi:predicted MFS family arabinose efflux permease
MHAFQWLPWSVCFLPLFVTFNWLLTYLQYYLKAQFGYSKDEFANLLLIAGAAGMLSQVPIAS